MCVFSGIEEAESSLHAVGSGTLCDWGLHCCCGLSLSHGPTVGLGLHPGVNSAIPPYLSFCSFFLFLVPQLFFPFCYFKTLLVSSWEWCPHSYDSLEVNDLNVVIIKLTICPLMSPISLFSSPDPAASFWGQCPLLLLSPLCWFCRRTATALSRASPPCWWLLAALMIS